MTRPAPRSCGAGRAAPAFALVAALALLSAGGPAGAATPGLAVDPPSAPPLATLKVTGSGFCPVPCSTVTITIGVLTVETGVAVDAAGRFETFVQIPDTTRPPEAPVIASQSDAGGSQVQARATLTVTVGQPPSVVYPTPSSIQPPSASPTDPSPTTVTEPSAGPPTSGGTDTTVLPSDPVTTSSSATTTTATGRSGWSAWPWVVLGVAVVALLAGGLWWRTRRAHQSGA